MPAFYKSFSVFSIVITALLALVVMLSWVFDFLPLLEMKTGAELIVFNTAVCFLIAAIAQLCLIFELRKATIVMSMVLLLFASLNVIQDILGQNLGVDTLLFQHEWMQSAPNPGRMAPNTSLLFILSAFILLLSSKKNWCLIMATVVMQCAIMLLGLSVLFGLGYFTAFDAIYRWGQFKAMAINTALGFSWLAISFISFITYMAKTQHIKVQRLIPQAVFLSLFIINLLLVFSVESQQERSSISSILPMVLFIVGTLFAFLFGLTLFYLQKVLFISAKEKLTSELLNTTLESVADGIIAAKANGDVIIFNQRFLSMWGFSLAEIRDRNFFGIIESMKKKLAPNQSFYEQIYSRLSAFVSHSNKPIIVELKNGYIYTISIKNQLNAENTIGYVLTITDITEPKKLEKELLHHSTHDPLTGLPNKSLLINTIQILIQHVKKQKKQIGLFLLDINRFHRVYDTFGQEKGDEMLNRISKRLCKYFNHAEIISRLSGNTFVVVMVLEKNEASEKEAEALIRLFKKPFIFHDVVLNFTCNVGYSLAPLDSSEPSDLIRLTDIALLRSQKLGTNQAARYQPYFSKHIQKELQIENELYTAINKDEFILHYQPIVDLKTMHFHKVEALLRWQNPRLGLMMPLDFINVAEETGLIVDIGALVLKKACAQMMQWEQNGLAGINVSVNIAAKHFINGRIADDVMLALKNANLPAQRLEIELLEQSLINNSGEVLSVLHFIQKQGVKIALDDFGTGYSNLTYIQNLPLNLIKIDRSFIMEISHKKASRDLIISIINMAKSFHLDVLAEGIETKQQCAFLKRKHCQYGQGFYFAKPMPADDCFAFLQKHFH